MQENETWFHVDVKRHRTFLQKYVYMKICAIIFFILMMFTVNQENIMYALHLIH